ncbi:NUDIX hydrolase [Bacteroidota bacterium]
MEKNKPSRFTVRSYGILLNAEKEVLLVHETMPEMEFTKFPGGGVEFGEGPEDCVVREFKEETGLDVKVDSHFYTTGHFQQSAFRSSDQLIAIYYLLKLINPKQELTEMERTLFISGKTEVLKFHWKSISQLTESDLSFPIDKFLVSRIREL